MTTEVTLAVPDEVYEQAEQTAKITNRAVSEVLVDTLVEAMPAFYVDPRRPIMQREKDAFIAMHPQLVEKHLGQYVAIYQGKLIDRDEKRIELLKRIRTKLPNEVVLITEVMWEADPVLHFRSTLRENTMKVYSYTYSNLYNPPAPVAEIGVGQVGTTSPEIKVQTLIDSGADATLIPIHVINAVQGEFVETRRMYGVTGVRSNVDVYAVTIRIGSHTIPDVWVVAIPPQGEAILGRDVLNHMIVTLNGLASTTEILE